MRWFKVWKIKLREWWMWIQQDVLKFKVTPITFCHNSNDSVSHKSKLQYDVAWSQLLHVITEWVHIMCIFRGVQTTDWPCPTILQTQELSILNNSINTHKIIFSLIEHLCNRQCNKLEKSRGPLPFVYLGIPTIHHFVICFAVRSTKAKRSQIHFLLLIFGVRLVLTI